MKTQTSAPNDIAELEPEFKIMLQATNRSPRTIEAYMAGVEALRAFLVERGLPTAADSVAREHVEAAYAAWIEAGYAAASVKNRHDGIRQFFAWCEEEGEVPEGKSPMRHVRSPRVPQNPPDILRDDEVRALLKACDGRTYEDSPPHDFLPHVRSRSKTILGPLRLMPPGVRSGN
jgi:site-specific recombinase XerD